MNKLFMFSNRKTFVSSHQRGHGGIGYYLPLVAHNGTSVFDGGDGLRDLSIEFVKYRLLDEQMKRKVEGVESQTAKSDSAAFSSGKQKKKKKIFKCYGCKQDGHKMAD